jgi:hypothetical protein
MTSHRTRVVVCLFEVAAFLVLTFTSAGCGGGGGSGGSGAPTFKVTLAYATPSGGSVIPCNEGRPAHIHPSWRGFQEVLPSGVSGGQTTYTSDVPVGSQQFAIMDPGLCTSTNLFGTMTSGVTANGVALTSVVMVPIPGLDNMANGLSFTVLPDGTIKP